MLSPEEREGEEEVDLEEEGEREVGLVVVVIGGGGEGEEVLQEVSISLQRLPPYLSVSGSRGDNRTPTSHLFVKLSYDTEKESLQELFPNATDIFLPRHRETGEKRGWG